MEVNIIMINRFLGPRSYVFFFQSRLSMANMCGVSQFSDVFGNIFLGIYGNICLLSNFIGGHLDHAIKYLKRTAISKLVTNIGLCN